MNIQFHVPRAKDAPILQKYFFLRPCKACEAGWLDYFLWSDYYRVRYHVADDRALLIVMKNDKEYFAAMPYCTEEDLPHYFRVLWRFFNDILEQPFKIYLADEEAVQLLKLPENPDFVVREEPDFRDYIYDAEKLRTLAGRKLQKKRNLIHAFERSYAGRWEYRTLLCQSRDEVLSFLDEWFPAHETEAAAKELVFERDGLRRLLQDCAMMQYRAGAIYIDDVLRAFSIGSYNPTVEMACISVEKADPAYPGLYQLINREFLRGEFPEAKLVNREDDMGLPGLRQAKESYYPLMYERKYMVAQRCFRGAPVDMTDPYETEVSGR